MITCYLAIILAHQFVLLLVRRRFEPFDVKTLIDVVLLAMFVYAPAVNPGLRAHLSSDLGFGLTTLLGIVALYLGLHAPTRFMRPSQPIVHDGEELRVGWLAGATALFILSTIGEVVRSVRMSGTGLWEYFTGNRLTEYAALLNEGPTGEFSFQLIELSRPVVLLWLGYALIQRKWRLSAILYGILLVGILLIFRTRLQVILALVLPLVFYHYRVRRLSLVGISVMAGSFLTLLYALNVWRGQGIDDLRASGVSANDVLESVAVNLSPLRGYELLWDQHATNTLQYEHGFTYLSVPMTVIPRAIWSAKPILSYEGRWTLNVFGQISAISEEGNGIWTFTVWGEGLTQFGVAGVFFTLFLYGLFVAWTDERAKSNPLFFLVWFYYSVFAATFLRSSLSSLVVSLSIALLPVAFVYGVASGRLRLYHRRPPVAGPVRLADSNSGPV